jgi:hypothetical protein
MIHRVLRITDWMVDFLFADSGYDIDGILACLRDSYAPKWVINEAYSLMKNCEHDCGFTYSRRNRYSYHNADWHRAVVLIGPTSSGAEFMDTFVHELRHLTDSIAKSLGVPLDSEEAAYISGDTARELADVICRLGCPN